MSRVAWTTIALLSLLLFAPLGAASSPPMGSVWTVYNRIEVDIQDNYAIVDVIAEIANRGPDPEFPFQVRVPEHAMVTGLIIERDGDVWEGRIEDRDAAREEYEGEKEQENTAALIEKKRGSQVYAFLVNVAEFQSVTATLRYELYLGADQGVHNLALEAPVSGFGQDVGAGFDATICHSGGLTSAWSPQGDATIEAGCAELSYGVGARDSDEPTPWSVHYMVEPTSDAGAIAAITSGGRGHFVHTFRAPEDATQLPLDLVLVLDTSGSMGQEQKLEQMQDAALQVVQKLDDADRLGIIEFNSEADAKWSGLAVADDDQRRDAMQAISGLIAAGATNIEDALRTGFGAYEGSDDCDALPIVEACDHRSQILVLLTDGQPTQGLRTQESLRSLAMEENPGVRIFTLAFGEGADWQLMSGLARDGGGAALRVPKGDGAEVDLRRFMAALTTPVLEDVQITYDGDVQAYRTTAPVLFQGSELIVVGHYPAGDQRISGNVSGTAHDGPRNYSFDEATGDAPNFLPRLVAYAEIQHYQRLIESEGHSQSWQDNITQIALEYSFVTDYTSLVLATEVDDPVRSYDPEGRDGCSNCAMEDAGPGGMSGPPATPTTPPASPPSTPPRMPSGPAEEARGEESTPVPIWLVAAALAVAIAARRRV